MAGGSNDPDDLIVRAFKAYETDGKIEAEMFRHALMNFGDKFNQAEIDDIFGEFEVDDDGFLESKAVIGLFVAGGGEEKKEEKKEEEAAPAADAPAEGGDEGGKERKRRKRRRKRKLHQQPTLQQREETKEARRKRRRRRLPSKWNELDRFLFIFFKPPYKYRCKHGL